MHRRRYPVVDEEKRKETFEILEFKLKKNEIERKQEIAKLKEIEKLKDKDDRMMYHIMNSIRFMKSVKREILKEIRKNMTKQEKKEKKQKMKQKKIDHNLRNKEIHEKFDDEVEIGLPNKKKLKIQEMEMEKDEPIYFLFRPMDESSSMLWYVIEDNTNDHIPENENAEFTKEGIIDVVCVPNTDRIRALHLPLPPFLPNHIYTTTLALFNSYLYLLGVGAYNLTTFTDILHKEDGWCLGPPFPSITPLQVINMTTSNNGSIVLRTIDSFFKKQFLWLSSLSSTWEKLPKPSKKNNLIYSSATILALTNTHLFTIMPSKKRSLCGVFFSFAERKWCVFDRNSFQGSWSKGVVFYDNYLVTYGTSTPRSLKKRPSLHVYDLKALKWLPHHPSKYKNAFPPPKHNQTPFLFQVGPNKLAVIWVRILSDSEMCHTVSVLYCTKFIIHKTSSTNQPSVYAEVFSHGTYQIDGGLVSCVARKNVEEIDKGTLVKSKNEILELAAKDSWFPVP